jgi:hypothetical protein
VAFVVSTGGKYVGFGVSGGTLRTVTTGVGFLVVVVGFLVVVVVGLGDVVGFGVVVGLGVVVGFGVSGGLLLPCGGK